MFEKDTTYGLVEGRFYQLYYHTGFPIKPLDFKDFEAGL